MKKKYSFTGLFLLTILLVFISCEIYKDISSTTDVKTDFSIYKTFAWLPDTRDTNSQPYNNEIIRNNIRNYFGQSFAERGYTVNLDKPDLLLNVVLTGTKKEKLVMSPYPGQYYYCQYYYGSIYYFPYPFDYYYRNNKGYCYPADYAVQNQEYIESSITLNVIDRVQNKSVWSGTAKGDIYDTKYLNRNIHPAVESIMSRYPIQKIGKKIKKENSDHIYAEPDSISSFIK